MTSFQPLRSPLVITPPLLGMLAAFTLSTPFPAHSQDAAAPTPAPATPAPAAPASEPIVDPLSDLPEETIAEIDAALSGTVGPGWLLNYRVAKEKAAKENKDLLLVFTGSDWIDICEQFDKQVLNTEAFFTPISDDFIAVRLDFPEKVKQNDTMKAQNQVLMQSYRVQGFPSVILTDSTGKPFAVNGYQAVTGDQYAAILKALVEVRKNRDKKFAAAKDAAGLEKAELLASGIPHLPGNLVAWFYRPELESLIANDLQNKTGKAVKFQRLINDVDYSRTMSILARNVEWSKMLSLTDDYIRGNQLKGEEMQHAMMNKIGILEGQGKFAEMAQTLLQIVAVDPKTSTAIKAQDLLDRMRVNNLQRGFGVTPAAPSEEAKP